MQKGELEVVKPLRGRLSLMKYFCGSYSNSVICSISRNHCLLHIKAFPRQLVVQFGVHDGQSALATLLNLDPMDSIFQAQTQKANASAMHD